MNTMNTKLLLAAAAYHAANGSDAALNPVHLANRVERIIWADGPEDVPIADYDADAFPVDFEMKEGPDGTFVGPDGAMWSKNVLGFGRAPRLHYLDGSDRVWVRPEMFCGRV